MKKKSGGLWGGAFRAESPRRDIHSGEGMGPLLAAQAHTRPADSRDGIGLAGPGKPALSKARRRKNKQNKQKGA